MADVYDTIEEEVHSLLLSKVHDVARVDALPTDADIEDMVRHIASKLDKYPGLFTFVSGSAESSADDDFLVVVDDVDLDIYVAVSDQRQQDQTVQRKKAEHWCAYVRKVLEGQQINTDMTAGGTIQGFSITPMFNVSGGFALYRVECTISELTIDLEQITKPTL